jgi:hypothetical protein
MTISNEIEFIKTTRNTNYLEAIILFSEENNLEIEILADNIRKDPVLISKLQYEAEDLNILKKGARLPI